MHGRVLGLSPAGNLCCMSDHGLPAKVVQQNIRLGDHHFIFVYFYYYFLFISEKIVVSSVFIEGYQQQIHISLLAVVANS